MDKFIQANINHSRAAQDLLLQDVLQEDVRVALVSEPYLVPDSAAWVADLSKTAAIWWDCARCELPCVLLKRGNGFVAVKMGDTIIVSCYISPNCSWREYTEFLKNLGDAIQEFANSKLLVGGDFNARSSVWGDRRTNGRGELLLELMLGLDLRVVNVGSDPTCVRVQGTSIVDVTWASPSLIGSVSNWSVGKDEETLSDHARIRFELGFVTETRGSGVSSFPRWALDSFSADYFAAACEAIMWVGGGSVAPENVEEGATRLRADLTMASDVAARRYRPAKRKSTYWWNTKIQELRQECIKTRRLYTKWRNRDNEEEKITSRSTYREARRALRKEIAVSKRSAWECLIKEVDKNPWGRPYRVVLKRLSGASTSATELMTIDALVKVLTDLFPSPKIGFLEPLESPLDGDEDGFPEEKHVTAKEVRDAVKGGKSGYTAPGLDGVPRKFLKAMPDSMTTRVRDFFNECLKKGVFPDIWRQSRLVLLPKPASSDTPPKFRPICLLDDISKAFERVVVSRLQAHLATLPDGGLSKRQFGFRPALSTMEPLIWLRDSASRVIAERRYGLALSVDIANAFNSIPHNVINDALVRKRVPQYLRTIIREYLRNRTIVFRACDGRIYEWPVLAGVPQGSVLGPLLWNIAFDYVLDLVLPDGCTMLCYADDTLLFIAGDTPEEVLHVTRVAASLVIYRIESLGLRVAFEKMEATWFWGGRSLRAPDSLVIRENNIAIGRSIKYLGVLFDWRVTFKSHLEMVANKAGGVMRALGKLMPNMRGPGEHKRRLYMLTTLSVVLYASPVWAESYGLRAAYRGPLATLQRLLALRVVRGYRTISFVAATLLARIPPLLLLVDKRRRVYERVREARDCGEYTFAKRGEIEAAAEIVVSRGWEAFARNDALPGRRVAEAILPRLLQWTCRLHGDLSHHMTQMITGHGVFTSYLCRIGKADTAACWFCDDLDDDAEHTLRVCPAWDTYRTYLAGALECDVEELNLGNIVTKILESERAWKAFNNYCVWVISEKIATERCREQEALRRDREGDAAARFGAGLGHDWSSGEGTPA